MLLSWKLSRFSQRRLPGKWMNPSVCRQLQFHSSTLPKEKNKKPVYNPDLGTEKWADSDDNIHFTVRTLLCLTQAPFLPGGRIWWPLPLSTSLRFFTTDFPSWHSDRYCMKPSGAVRLWFDFFNRFLNRACSAEHSCFPATQQSASSEGRTAKHTATTGSFSLFFCLQKLQLHCIPMWSLDTLCFSSCK
ncbi:uncharacterized protein LOC116228823 isoform X2 [Phasianus colchicus]|uniref:uncharacterized protein LOC116228823 isoform X2 n=1 Tax=Phasianus colchicus TaxID=9054 RepID=UPI00129E861C|nr:uncharacterized protein LOC116228823 isoform X2 [Phasianus colchicus]